jgi:7-cyano-7-deazaguanine reductase
MNEPDRSLAGAPLGQHSAPVDTYQPALLFAVPRGASRRAAGIGDPLPFRGVDLWTAWELSWLDRRGKPVAAALRLVVPATTPAIVESKSLKLYLGSFAQTRFDSPAHVAHVVRTDLHAAIGAEVASEIVSGAGLATLDVRPWSGESIDGIDVDVDTYEPDPSLLALAGESAAAPDRGSGTGTGTSPNPVSRSRAAEGTGTHTGTGMRKGTGTGRHSAEVVEETLCSDLLRTNCPVTGQPDIGSVQIRYRGPRIDRAALLRYLVSYRRHCAFHETCVERIWSDIRRTCLTQSLTVYARYLRRGGIDINPFRSDVAERPDEDVRLVRQ